MNFVRTSTDMIDMTKVLQVSKEAATASSGSVNEGETLLKVSHDKGTITLFGTRADEMWAALGEWHKGQNCCWTATATHSRIADTQIASQTAQPHTKNAAVVKAANAVKLENSNG